MIGSVLKTIETNVNSRSLRTYVIYPWVLDYISSQLSIKNSRRRKIHVSEDDTAIDYAASAPRRSLWYKNETDIRCMPFLFRTCFILTHGTAEIFALSKKWCDGGELERIKKNVLLSFLLSWVFIWTRSILLTIKWKEKKRSSSFRLLFGVD